MTSQLYKSGENWSTVPGEKHSLAPSHWQLSVIPRSRFKPGQWCKTASNQWQCHRPQFRFGNVDGELKSKSVWTRVVISFKELLQKDKGLVRVTTNAKVQGRIFLCYSPWQLRHNIAAIICKSHGMNGIIQLVYIGKAFCTSFKVSIS